MTNARCRLSTIALTLGNLLACSGGSDAAPRDFGQDVAVQIIPAFAELATLESFPFSAYVSGTLDTGVTWEVAEPIGGSIAADGVYSAPASDGVYHVVARSTAAPAASATAQVTVTPTPTYPAGKALGVNLGSWAYWDSQAFADTARQGDYRAADGGFLANADAQGWPASDFVVYVGAHAAGAYAIRFNGRANVSNMLVTYDAATNTSTGTYNLGTAPTSGFIGFTFRDTMRTATSATNTGVTNLKIMRPGRALDVGTAATRFEPDYVAAIQTFQWFRASTTFGTSAAGVNGNTDAYWSDADAIAAGVPAYRPGATYTFGDKVLSNGKVYLATFPLGTMSGAAGSSAPNHAAKGHYDQAIPADGSVYWRRAARVLPNGCGGSKAGPAWEDLVLLANRTRVSPWFTIPYFASDSYVTKLARLIKYGSDANGEPYTSRQASPVYPPLALGIPFVIEWSNEIWNGIAPYPGEFHDPLTEAAFNSGNPWRLTSTNYYTRGLQSSAALTARMSVLFRQVFGDAEMMTRVRPVWAGQLGRSNDYAGAACGVALTYLNTVWNAPATATVNGYAAGHPPSWYVYGVAGAPYDHWTGATVDELFASWTANLTTLTARLQAWDQWASEYGIKSLTYEGGNETTSVLVSQAQVDSRYAKSLTDLTHAFWSTPHGTADVYMHYRMDTSANNSTLGVPAATPFGNGDYVAAYRRSVVTRDTPGWTAMRALRAETGR